MEHRFKLENHAFIFHPLAAKVNQITQPDSGATQFIQQLGFMRRLINRVSLQLHDDLFNYQQIGGVITDNNAFELNLNFGFKLHLHSTQLQFSLHGALIDFFQKPKAENIVNFKCGTNQMLRHRL